MAGPYGILIVDDSSLSREALRRVLESDGQLRVVGEARTGEEAVELVKTLKPQLVTMDLQMPGMGGLKAIEIIMRERPTPIVVISERSSTPGNDLNYQALSRGALELVPKSAVFGVGSSDVRRFAEHLRLLAASGREEESPLTAQPAPPIPVTTEPPLLLGIGASTGGPKALAKVLGQLPPDFPLPIAVVQHMAEDFFDSFVRYLGDASGRSVTQAKHGTALEAGRVFVAPPRQEMFIKDNLTVKLLPPPPESLISPSVDSLFFSMATALKARGMGVLLTGMGDDGAQGLLRMRRMGARTVAQDRASSAVFGMPKAAMELGAAEVVLPLERIAGFCADTARGSGRHKGPALQRRRVLVLDDDAQTRTAAVTALEGAGYELLQLDNPLVLATTLRKAGVDLVLLESELTTMSGALVMQTLRNHGLARVPVFLYSRLEEGSLAARAAECGALGFLRKGSPPATIVREVSSFLGGPTRQ